MITEAPALKGIVVPGAASIEPLIVHLRTPVPTSLPVIETESGSVIIKFTKLNTLAFAVFTDWKNKDIIETIIILVFIS